MESITNKQLYGGILIYVLVSFAVQALSHFAVNVDHYQNITFVRDEPIIYMGMLTMCIQGTVLSYCYYKHTKSPDRIGSGIGFGLLMWLLLTSYIAIVEPSKYQVNNISQWMIIEGSAGLIQFVLFGGLLTVLYRKNKR